MLLVSIFSNVHWLCRLIELRSKVFLWSSKEEHCCICHLILVKVMLSAALALGSFSFSCCLGWKLSWSTRFINYPCPHYSEYHKRINVMALSHTRCTWESFWVMAKKLRKKIDRWICICYKWIQKSPLGTSNVGRVNLMYNVI